MDTFNVAGIDGLKDGLVLDAQIIGLYIKRFGHTNMLVASREELIKQMIVALKSGKPIEPVPPQKGVLI